jgi:hypothetical protein
MNDQTNRRLLIIFGISLLISVGAIAIGIMGLVGLYDAGFLDTVQNWIEPIVSIRSDGPTISGEPSTEEGFLALDFEATRMAEKQGAIEAIFADWPIVIEETFVKNDLEWPEFQEEDDLGDLTVEFASGKYRWQAHANDGFIWWSSPRIDPFTDFYAEIEVAQIEGDQYGEIGLVYRLEEDRYYLFEISGGEYFSVWRSDPDGWNEMMDWTTSASIQSLGTNKLGVLAIGDQFYLFINDQLVAEVSDDQLERGVLGVAIGLDEAEDTGIFEFDNLQIRTPVESTTETTEPDGD